MNVLERVNMLEKRAEEDRAGNAQAFQRLFDRVAMIEEILGIAASGVSDCNTKSTRISDGMSVGMGQGSPAHFENVAGVLLASDTDERLGRIEHILKSMEERRIRNEQTMQEAAATILDEPVQIKKRQNPPRSVRRDRARKR